MASSGADPDADDAADVDLGADYAHRVDDTVATIASAGRHSAWVVVTCDRCDRDVLGLDTPLGTAGFYRTSPGSTWAPYSDRDESRLCEPCMHADPAYAHEYGDPPYHRRARRR